MNIVVLMVITLIMTLEEMGPYGTHEPQQEMEVMFQDLDEDHVETLTIKPHGVDECFDLRRGEARCQVCLPQSITLVEIIPMTSSEMNVPTKPTKGGSSTSKLDVNKVMLRWLGPLEGNLYTNDVPPPFEDMTTHHPSHVTFSTRVAINVGNFRSIRKGNFWDWKTISDGLSKGLIKLPNL